MTRTALILLLLPGIANATWPFSEPPHAWIGADAQIRASNNGQSTYCPGNGNDTANFGVGQVLKRTERAVWSVQWTHHSCLIRYYDRNVYDGIGISVRVNFW